ncbi:aldehyde reductase ii [Seiridium cupressi]
MNIFPVKFITTRDLKISKHLGGMSSDSSTAIPEDSLVLITGATSYLASYVIKDFLERGYHVRGVVRDISQAVWLTEEVFPLFAQNGLFDLVEVPNQTVSNAFDTVIADSKPSAILHFATPFDFSPDPNKVIPEAVAGILGLLRAAAREPSVKRFVYTSTIGAVYSPKGGISIKLNKNCWNDAALNLAWAPPPYESQRGVYVYAASKIEAERAMFKFVEDENPGFAVNAVNPFLVIGPALHKRHLKGTAGWIRNAYNGEAGLLAVMPPSRQVNVQDVAALHVATALDPGVKGERLLAWGEPINLNMVLNLLRRQYPERNFIEDIPPQKLCLATIEDEDYLLGLLKKWGGRDGWISLEQSTVDGKEIVPDMDDIDDGLFAQPAPFLAVISPGTAKAERVQEEWVKALILLDVNLQWKGIPEDLIKVWKGYDGDE